MQADKRCLHFHPWVKLSPALDILLGRAIFIVMLLGLYSMTAKTLLGQLPLFCRIPANLIERLI